GNTTGLSSSLEDIVAKHVELLAMAVPGLSRIAVLVDPSNPNHPEALKKAEAAASLGGLAIIVVEARTSDELESSFRAMREHGVGALVALPDSLFTNSRRRIADLALSTRLPSVFAERDFVEAGGLMSHGESLRDFNRRAAAFVDKIFKGAKPG